MTERTSEGTAKESSAKQKLAEILEELQKGCDSCILIQAGQKCMDCAIDNLLASGLVFRSDYRDEIKKEIEEKAFKNVPYKCDSDAYTEYENGYREAMEVVSSVISEVLSCEKEGKEIKG